MFKLDRPVSGVWNRPKISRNRKIQQEGKGYTSSFPMWPATFCTLSSILGLQHKLWKQKNKTKYNPFPANTLNLIAYSYCLMSGKGVFQLNVLQIQYALPIVFQIWSNWIWLRQTVFMTDAEQKRTTNADSLAAHYICIYIVHVLHVASHCFHNTGISHVVIQ